MVTGATLRRPETSAPDAGEFQPRRVGIRTTRRRSTEIFPAAIAAGSDPAPDAVVVPLDGSWLAEAALEPALALATLLGVPVRLLRLVSGPLSLSPWAAVPPEAASDLRDEAAGAEIYLAEVADRLRKRGAREALPTYASIGG